MQVVGPLSLPNGSAALQNNLLSVGASCTTGGPTVFDAAMVLVNVLTAGDTIVETINPPATTAQKPLSAVATDPRFGGPTTS